jgi:hypothetical protein
MHRKQLIQNIYQNQKTEDFFKDQGYEDVTVENITIKFDITAKQMQGGSRKVEKILITQINEQYEGSLLNPQQVLEIINDHSGSENLTAILNNVDEPYDFTAELGFTFVKLGDLSISPDEIDRIEAEIILSNPNAKVGKPSKKILQGTENNQYLILTAPGGYINFEMGNFKVKPEKVEEPVKKVEEKTKPNLGIMPEIKISNFRVLGVSRSGHIKFSGYPPGTEDKINKIKEYTASERDFSVVTRFGTYEFDSSDQGGRDEPSFRNPKTGERTTLSGILSKVGITDADYYSDWYPRAGRPDNPATIKLDDKVTKKEAIDIIKKLEKNFLDGVTYSGGSNKYFLPVEDVRQLQRYFTNTEGLDLKIDGDLGLTLENSNGILYHPKEKLQTLRAIQDFRNENPEYFPKGDKKELDETLEIESENIPQVNIEGLNLEDVIYSSNESVTPPNIQIMKISNQIV